MRVFEGNEVGGQSLLGKVEIYLRTGFWIQNVHGTGNVVGKHMRCSFQRLQDHQEMEFEMKVDAEERGFRWKVVRRKGMEEEGKEAERVVHWFDRTGNMRTEGMKPVLGVKGSSKKEKERKQLMVLSLLDDVNGVVRAEYVHEWEGS